MATRLAAATWWASDGRWLDASRRVPRPGEAVDRAGNPSRPITRVEVTTPPCA